MLHPATLRSHTLPLLSKRRQSNLGCATTAVRSEWPVQVPHCTMDSGILGGF